MNNFFIFSLISVFLVSLLSILGIIFFVFLSKKDLQKVTFLAVSFSAGGLLGGAFFHLIPEALESQNSRSVFALVFVGFSIFYIMERFLLWHHCHKENCQTHKILGYQNLFGDGIHNFIDGLIIVSSFSVDTTLGMAVTISVILHEIPQEIGDFGVLLYSGFSKKKAIFFNFLSALLAFLGVIVGYFLIGKIENLVEIMLPLAGGGFIYIASADLIPELHREKNIWKSLGAFLLFVSAIGLMFFI